MLLFICTTGHMNSRLFRIYSRVLAFNKGLTSGRQDQQYRDLLRKKEKDVIFRHQSVHD